MGEEVKHLKMEKETLKSRRSPLPGKGSEVVVDSPICIRHPIGIKKPSG
jgi:hypothetical protein